VVGLIKKRSILLNIAWKVKINVKAHPANTTNIGTNAIFHVREDLLL